MMPLTSWTSSHKTENSRLRGLRDLEPHVVEPSFGILILFLSGLVVVIHPQPDAVIDAMFDLCPVTLVRTGHLRVISASIFDGQN